MTPEERIEYFAKMSATMLAQLEELRALHEQIRQVEQALLERQEVVQKVLVKINKPAFNVRPL